MRGRSSIDGWEMRTSMRARANQKWLMLRLRLQLDVPVEIVAPARVEIVRWEGAPVLLQLPAGRPDRLALDVHVGFPWRAAALAQVAGRTGGGDILPHRPAALGARDDMVERQLLSRPAVNAAESVAQEQVEPGERRIFVGLHELPQRNHRRQ